MAMQTRESRERQARKKMPRREWEQRACHALLHPSPEQEQALWRTCHSCWFLRALLVNERNDNRKLPDQAKPGGGAAAQAAAPRKGAERRCRRRTPPSAAPSDEAAPLQGSANVT